MGRADGYGRRIKRLCSCHTGLNGTKNASAEQSAVQHSRTGNQQPVEAQETVPTVSPQLFRGCLWFSEPFGLTGCWLPVRECWNADCSADAFFAPFSPVWQEQSLLMRRPYGREGLHLASECGKLRVVFRETSRMTCTSTHPSRFDAPQIPCGARVACAWRKTRRNGILSAVDASFLPPPIFRFGAL